MLLGRSEACDEQRVAGTKSVLFRNERRGRRAQGDSEKAGRIIRKRLDEVAAVAQCLGPVFQPPEEQRNVHHRADLVEREFERRDDAKVSATAGKRPEQVGVLVLRGAHDARVRRDHFGGDEVVAGEPRFLREPTDAAAEGEPRNARVADEATRRGKAVLLGSGIEIRPRRAAAAYRPARGGVDGDTVHRAEVDHHAAIADGVACVVVTTAPDGDFKLPRSGEADRLGDLCRTRAARDDRRFSIDRAVPHRATVVVFGITGGQNLAAKRRAKRIDLIGNAAPWSTPPQLSL